jgi:hypothetical protein
MFLMFEKEWGVINQNEAKIAGYNHSYFISLIILSAC